MKTARYILLIFTLCITRIYAQDGNVGIGTENPTATLDIRNNASEPAAILKLTTQDENHFLRMVSGHENDPYQYINWKIDNDFLFSSSNADFSGWQEHMRMETSLDGPSRMIIGGDKAIIDEFGNFGLGTLSPSYRMDILSNSPEAGSVLQLSNSDKSSFIRLFGGTTTDPNSWVNWKKGNPILFSSANNDFTEWSEKMRIEDNGNVGIGTSQPDARLHVSGSGGQGVYAAKIQNTNPNGSGLVIQIDGKHPMLLPGDVFPPKIPTPLEFLVQPIASKIKERILDGDPFKAPTIDDFLDIVNGVVDPNSVNLLKELGLDQLVLAAACDGTEYISSLVQFPDLDINSINSDLPDIFSSIPAMNESTIDLPNFPSNLGSFALPTGIQINTSGIDVFNTATWPSAFSLATTTYVIPSPPNLPNITIPAFDTWNSIFDSRDINGDLQGFYSGFNNLKNQMSSKFSAGSLIISDNLNCASTPNLSNIELILPDFSDLPKESMALDERNHFVTFVDGGHRELGAIKAQHPADYAISQLSTANVLEIAAIIPGIISDDGNIVENIVNLAGFGYQWVEGYNSIGVSYESSFGDYAEWLPKKNQKEEISYGDVIGIKGGYISKDLTDAEQVMVVSKAPIIMGNAPDPERLSEGKNIAFIGQVPVKVMGPVRSGDFIVADLSRAGFAKAIHPNNMTSHDHQFAVGRSWDNDDSEGFKFVNTLVGMHNNSWIKPMKKMQESMEKMETRLTAIEDQLMNIDLNKN